MASINYLLDRSKTPEGDYQLLPTDFLARFVAAAKHNKSLLIERDQAKPDLMFISGIDQHGRHLLGSWSTHPANIIDGANIVMFRDIAQDQDQDKI
jgi:hypothetical protein